MLKCGGFFFYGVSGGYSSVKKSESIRFTE